MGVGGRGVPWPAWRASAGMENPSGSRLCGRILKYFQCVPLLVDSPKFPIIVKPMDVELNNLEEKIGQFVALCHHLRAENTQLRQQLAAAINENKQLVGKIAESRRRLEGLLERIPEDAE